MYRTPNITRMPLEGALLQINKAAPLARSESIWLGIGTALMIIGTFYFMAKGWGVEDEEAKEYYVITIMIPAIAAASYLSMFLGFGLTEITLNTGRTLDIYWARYADWLFTTPLLLLDLALLADADFSEILALITLDGFMIITGLVGALTTVFTFRFIWWALSTLAMVFILYFLFSVLTAKVEEMDEDTQGTFRVLRNLTIVLWTLYPVLWIVGTEGAGIVPLFVETLGFMVLDVLAKVGFGFILLRSRAILGETSAPTPSETAAAGD
jgi:bacteriorhodopsin